MKSSQEQFKSKLIGHHVYFSASLSSNKTVELKFYNRLSLCKKPENCKVSPSPRLKVKR